MPWRLGLFVILAGCKEGHQGAFDRGLARRRGDLCPHKVRHIKHVNYAFAKRCDMRGGNVEIELRQRCRQFIEKARTVKTGDLDHGVTVGPLDRKSVVKGKSVEQA